MTAFNTLRRRGAALAAVLLLAFACSAEDPFNPDVEPDPDPDPDPDPPGEPVPGDHPHEPDGFVFITEHPFDEELPDGWELFNDDNNRLTIGEDAAAPFSAPSIGLARYEAGFVGGRGPFTLLYGGLNARELYVDFFFRIDENWQGHTSGVNKIFFIIDESEGSNRAPLYFSAQGSNDDDLHFQVRSQFTPVGAVNYGYASSGNEIDPSAADAEIVRGQWHRIEVVLVMNHPGDADGEIHVWMDGVKTHQFTGEQFVLAGSDGDLDHIKWNGTFGGSDIDSVENTQYQYLDHVYLSGRE